MRVSAGDASSLLASPREAPSENAGSSEKLRGEGPSPFARVMRSLGRELNHGEETMRSAVDAMRAGGDFGPSQLIGLEVGVYRYSETIDLASRAIDRATSAVKTVLQGGGQ